MKIELCNLEKHFGTNTAVDIKSFTINNGDILGLVGNNGAGKTTLFRLMLDLLKADEGVVTMRPATEGAPKAINPALSEDWKAYTGAYIDDGFLIDFLTAEEYFDFIGRVSGMTKEHIAERLTSFEPLMNGEILNQKKYIRDFSAGNRHKVGIIAALLNPPRTGYSRRAVQLPRPQKPEYAEEGAARLQQGDGSYGDCVEPQPATHHRDIYTHRTA